MRFAHFVYIVRNLLVRIAECLCVCAEFISANFTLIRTNKFRTFLFHTILFSHFLIPLRYPRRCFVDLAPKDVFQRFVTAFYNKLVAIDIFMKFRTCEHNSKCFFFYCAVHTPNSPIRVLSPFNEQIQCHYSSFINYLII